MSSHTNKPKFARVGPVHFQPLEWELRSLSNHFEGKTLNAGCGNRDIAATLREFGATEVVNYDLYTNIPGAITGSLEVMPFQENTFDTIICNAVLEHVVSIDLVLKELHRVLKPGGCLTASVPFLQPFHLSPTDFRRFTKDGLHQLGENYGFQTVTIYPVHSIAQTLGWITWEYLLEKNKKIAQALLWPVIYLFTRLFCRTDLTLINNANALQAVYVKPV
jgi:SAM-dependent methyltransferase